MKILALDLGKYKTVFCDYNSNNGEHEFGKVKTTPQTIHDLIVEKEPQRVVLEYVLSPDGLSILPEHWAKKRKRQTLHTMPGVGRTSKRKMTGRML